MTLIAKAGLTAVVLLGAASRNASAQVSTRLIDRSDRVVLWSPHFDTPPIAFEPLNCPNQPPRYYGFESPRGRDSNVSVLMRVVNPAPKGMVYPIRGLVRLSHRLVDSTFSALPQSGELGGMTDSSGAIRLTARAGIYQLSVRALGFPLAEGIVQLRAGARASVLIQLLPAVLC